MKAPTRCDRCDEMFDRVPASGTKFYEGRTRFVGTNMCEECRKSHDEWWLKGKKAVTIEVK